MSVRLSCFIKHITTTRDPYAHRYGYHEGLEDFPPLVDRDGNRGTPAWDGTNVDPVVTCLIELTSNMPAIRTVQTPSVFSPHAE